MKLSVFKKTQAKQVASLLGHTFAVSEGEREGKMIETLIGELLNTTAPEDILGFTASSHQDELWGAIFFSRFTIPGDQSAFILSPVGVSPNVQSNGIGQALITYGLDTLRMNGVDIVVTYGDPNYYSKVGFEQISEDVIQAPFKLSQPHGWIAQSLNGKPIPLVGGPTRCVEALNRSEYW